MKIRDGQKYYFEFRSHVHGVLSHFTSMNVIRRSVPFVRRGYAYVRGRLVWIDRRGGRKVPERCQLRCSTPPPAHRLLLSSCAAAAAAAAPQRISSRSLITNLHLTHWTRRRRNHVFSACARARHRFSISPANRCRNRVSSGGRVRVCVLFEDSSGTLTTSVACKYRTKEKQ